MVRSLFGSVYSHEPFWKISTPYKSKWTDKKMKIKRKKNYFEIQNIRRWTWDSKIAQLKVEKLQHNPSISFDAVRGWRR